IPIATPKRHPFNPLALSRLLWASAPDGATPSRWACETVLRHVWRSDGADAEDPARLAGLRAAIAPRREPSSDEVKERLRDATDEALARGVFGVPTIGVADKRLWGFDALDMVAALLRNDPWFAAPHWEREGAPRDGVQRSRGCTRAVHPGVGSGFPPRRPCRYPGRRDGKTLSRFALASPR